MSRAVLALVMLAIGCGSSAEGPAAFRTGGSDGSEHAGDDDDDDNASTNDSSYTSNAPDTSTARPSGAAPAVPAAKGLQVWHAKLASAPTVDFGGGKWCKYHVALSNIDVLVTLDAQGRVVSSTLTNTMNESATDCAAQPLGVRQNSYAFQPKEPLASFQVLQAPDPKNLPQANVTVTFTPVDSKHMTGHLVFQRTGGADYSLNWQVAADIQLAPE